MLSFDLPQDSSNRTFNPVEIYDTVIIGGGPAGLTAGLYAARAGLKAVILEMAMPGGQAATTERIENYPGFVEGIGGAELTARMAEQALRFGAKTITAEVTGVEIEGETKRVSTPDGEFAGRTIIVATGARSSRLGVAGEAEFTGRGVSYCATCDGPFYRDLPIAVIGGGDSPRRSRWCTAAISSERPRCCRIELSPIPKSSSAGTRSSIAYAVENSWKASSCAMSRPGLRPAWR